MRLISLKGYKLLIFSIMVSAIVLLLCYGVLMLIDAYENPTEDWETVNQELEAVIKQPTEQTKAEAEESKGNHKKSTSETEFHLLINLNKAGVSELEKLPGVGPVKAKAIVDYRVEHGDFQIIDEIKKVKGIGPVTFENVKEFITIVEWKDVNNLDISPD
jgi:comEA protein